MSLDYNLFFDRVPEELLRCIGNGCNMGDKAYAQLIDNDPKLFSSNYMRTLRSRIHDKAIQMYISERLSNIESIQLSEMNTGFGNRVLLISNKNFSINACHITKLGLLPFPAKYKLTASRNNPGDEYKQLNIFTHPSARSAKDYSNVYFIITTFFNGTTTIPNLVLPNNKFTNILDSKPIISIISSDEKEENVYQQRRIPKLIEEAKRL